MNKAIENIPRIFAVIQVAYAGNGVPDRSNTAVRVDGHNADNRGTQAGSTPARHSRVQNKSLDGCGYGTLGGFDSRRRTNNNKNATDMRQDEQQMKQRRQQIHILCGRLGMGDDDRRAMLLANYGVESTFAMSAAQMDELIRALDTKLSDCRGVVSKASELDTLRKRLMGAIGRWLTATGHSNSAEMIKAVACRAAGKKSFNAIPADRLRSLYGAFTKRLKDLMAVSELEQPAVATENGKRLLN